MNTSSMVSEAAMAKDVRVTARALVVELQDGRTVSVPLQWYPRLAYGSHRERQQWELIGPGLGIHWPALDEDISVVGLLQGLPSGESDESFARWLSARRGRANTRVRSTKARHRSVPKRETRRASSRLKRGR
jgi:hypothetical protein